jgi:hypothetical protein
MPYSMQVIIIRSGVLGGKAMSKPVKSDKKTLPTHPGPEAKPEELSTY